MKISPDQSWFSGRLSRWPLRWNISRVVDNPGGGNASRQHKNHDQLDEEKPHHREALLPLHGANPGRLAPREGFLGLPSFLLEAFGEAHEVAVRPSMPTLTGALR